jgi:hypothetical protein
MKAFVLFGFLFFAVLTLPEKLCAQAAVTGSRIDSMIRKSRLAASVTGSIPADTIIDGLRKKLRQRQQDQSPIDGMPNAFKMNLGPDVYEGNNGKGQDIYRSQLDNMAILKPDSSSAGYIPNAITPLPARPRITDENGDVRWRPAPTGKVVSGTFDNKGNFIPANPYPSLPKGKTYRHQPQK